MGSTQCSDTRPQFTCWGLVRRDEDELVTSRYDVPLFKNITKYIVNPESTCLVIETRANKPEKVNLEVNGQDGISVYFMIPMQTP